MSEKSTPILDRTARSMHNVLFEPYDPEHPTLTDRAVKFISTVQNPDLTEEQRRQDINRCKPWFKGTWSVVALFDGHPVLAALPFLFARRQPKAPQAPQRIKLELRPNLLKSLLKVFGLILLLCALDFCHAHAQQPTTYRDANGRLQSTATDNRDGTTTFRDANGRLQSTATRNGDGTTTFRDANGRLQSTSRK